MEESDTFSLRLGTDGWIQGEVGPVYDVPKNCLLVIAHKMTDSCDTASNRCRNRHTAPMRWTLAQYQCMKYDYHVLSIELDFVASAELEYVAGLLSPAELALVTKISVYDVAVDFAKFGAAGPQAVLRLQPIGCPAPQRQFQFGARPAFDFRRIPVWVRRIECLTHKRVYDYTPVQRLVVYLCCVDAGLAPDIARVIVALLFDAPVAAPPQHVTDHPLDLSGAHLIFRSRFGGGPIFAQGLPLAPAPRDNNIVDASDSS